VLGRLRAICLAFPETQESPAWVGVRWFVRRSAVAHVLMVDAQWPPAYARAVPVRVATPVLTFRSHGTELPVLRAAPPPFHAPPWHPAMVCLELGAGTDWTEVAELLTESYRAVAPRSLTTRLP
jgi:hypothetical protein